MNETEQLYQKIFSKDRLERWESWQGHGNKKSGVQECGDHPLAQPPKKKNRWNGGVTYCLGYRVVLVPDHPRANGIGYVREHILIAEIALGRFLPKYAVVHHINEDKLDNRPCNLLVCENRAHHNMIHRRLRAMKECGNPDWLRCPLCKMWDAPENLYVRQDHNRFAQARHRHCHAKDVLNSQRKKQIACIR